MDVGHLIRLKNSKTTIDRVSAQLVHDKKAAVLSSSPATSAGSDHLSGKDLLSTLSELDTKELEDRRSLSETRISLR